MSDIKSNSQTKKKTFWPYGILLSILAIILACATTIIFSLDYPVYEDDSFMQKYQSVDRNINDIKQKQINFEKNYHLSLNLKPQLDKKKREFYELESTTTELEILLREVHEDISAYGISFEALLTRPHTNKQDTKLEILSFNLANSDTALLKKSFNTYSLKIALPNLEKGRWQIKLKAQKDDTQIAFYTYNLVIQ
ncbi:FixH family protein [Campylobacter sp. MIT 97-5078]|uniref:FixH family protein n=1 Tax=Campylobacter sp. MIT 97-5078 TaxID=1548153 RepID=UPI00051389C5|nr:FixH family protein [Campylobacter sp. MIT 97-5078]KGI55647.1 hypothetical protein LR59_11035 [Campylobacter sp. MIT 97-5078]KGI57657.1 hypothetical protein LR59_02935 [Campylobacter sp. MIT 97-5078]TQR26877.1 hypothetical protein DMB91_05720 [Campylobacter sp. MIT 97-5078]